MHYIALTETTQISTARTFLISVLVYFPDKKTQRPFQSHPNGKPCFPHTIYHFYAGKSRLEGEIWKPRDRGERQMKSAEEPIPQPLLACIRRRAIMNSQGAKALVRDTWGRLRSRASPREELIALVAIMLTHGAASFPAALIGSSTRFCQVSPLLHTLYVCMCNRLKWGITKWHFLCCKGLPGTHLVHFYFFCVCVCVSQWKPTATLFFERELEGIRP